MAVTVLADEADINADEQHEDERLDKADEQLEKVEWRRQTPLFDAAHGVHQVFTAENVAEKTERERNRTEENRNNLNQARGEKYQKKRIIDDRGGFLLVGLVAKKVFQDKHRPRKAHDKIKPPDKRHGGERDGAIHVGIAGTDKLHPFARGPASDIDSADAGEEAAPVLEQDKGEKRNEQREGVGCNLWADNRRDEGAHAFHKVFYNGLASRGNEFRFSDDEPDNDDENQR